jgi:hypothetical protein
MPDAHLDLFEDQDTTTLTTFVFGMVFGLFGMKPESDFHNFMSVLTSLASTLDRGNVVPESQLLSYCRPQAFVDKKATGEAGDLWPHFSDHARLWRPKAYVFEDLNKAYRSATVSEDVEEQVKAIASAIARISDERCRPRLLKYK